MYLNKFKFQSIAAISIVAMLFACDSDLSQGNNFNQEVDVPQGITTHVNLFYTDSGKVRANLKSPKILDYSQEEFAYRIFPDGVEVDFFNKDSTKNTIYADSAIVFNSSRNQCSIPNEYSRKSSNNSSFCSNRTTKWRLWKL